MHGQGETRHHSLTNGSDDKPVLDAVPSRDGAIVPSKPCLSVIFRNRSERIFSHGDNEGSRGCRLLNAAFAPELRTIFRRDGRLQVQHGPVWLKIGKTPQPARVLWRERVVYAGDVMKRERCVRRRPPA